MPADHFAEDGEQHTDVVVQQRTSRVIQQHADEGDELQGAVAEKSVSLRYQAILPHAFSSSLVPDAVQTGSAKVSGRSGSKGSFAHISVTRSSVVLRLVMLWVLPGSMYTA